MQPNIDGLGGTGPGSCRGLLSGASSDTGRRLRIFLRIGIFCAATLGVVAGASSEPQPSLEVATERTIYLPPYIVSAVRIGKHPWRYASVPGFEILSRASASDTEWCLDALRRGLWFENQVLPEDWRPVSRSPYTLIVDDADLRALQSPEIQSPRMIFSRTHDALSWGELSRSVGVWMDQFDAHDQDTYSLSANVSDAVTRSPAFGSISLERLARSTPALPRWVTVGLAGKRCGIFREGFMLSVQTYGGRDEEAGGPDIRGVAGPGVLWINAEETRELLARMERDKKKKEETDVALLPLQALFGETPQAEKDELLWESEAALFVRWGLMGPGHSDPILSRAFLEFVRRARRGPVTEQVFIECFGFGYKTMEKTLSRFLVTVLAEPNRVDVKFPVSFSGLSLADASAAQTGRILGDWLRMQGDATIQRQPEMSKKLFETAEMVLLRAYAGELGHPLATDLDGEYPRSSSSTETTEKGQAGAEPVASQIRDPGLLAVYGLYLHDVGRDVQAKGFLERAVEVGAERPRVYLLLAQIRYKEAMEKPRGVNGKLNEEQAAFILEPLRKAERFGAVFDTYSLITQTWIHCDAKPETRDIETIVEGVTLYPRNTKLALLAALVCAENGYIAQANTLIDQGLVFAADSEVKGRFEALRASLVR